MCSDAQMKTTRYFEYAKRRSDRAQIKEEWLEISLCIEYVLENPKKVEVQSDGRIRKWAKISGVDKYLRVILLEDGGLKNESQIFSRY